jgi:hypothetical protein
MLLPGMMAGRQLPLHLSRQGLLQTGTLLVVLLPLLLLLLLGLAMQQTLLRCLLHWTLPPSALPPPP